MILLYINYAMNLLLLVEANICLLFIYLFLQAEVSSSTFEYACSTVFQRYNLVDWRTTFSRASHC